MRDPFSWSLPIVQIAGVIVRVHTLMPVILGGIVLREVFRAKETYVVGAWVDAAIVMGMLFLVILLHEFGHCFAARSVGGDANEVLLWPLGGLASVELPQSAAAHFWTALGGPLVNVAICAGAALALAFALDTAWQPPWNPLAWKPLRDAKGLVEMTAWNGDVEHFNAEKLGPTLFLARLFYVAWITLLLNLIVVAFPLDGGRILQALFWPRLGYVAATQAAIFVGFVTMFVVICVSVVVWEPLVLLLAFYIYMACKQEWLLLTTGKGEEALFGYENSLGYASPENDATAMAPTQPPKRRMSALQRWLQRRRLLKQRRELEQQRADERRMDDLLIKINEHGAASLTAEEQRFMKRVAEWYRNRH